MNPTTLLQPISASSPTGVDLRTISEDLTFIQLQEWRREFPPEEDLSVRASDDAKRRGKQAEWQRIAESCEEALRTRTKDLELICWLTEAWMRLQGLEGLQCGLELLRATSQQFWPELHPGLEDGDVIDAVRARPFAWLGSSNMFLQSLARTPLMWPPGHPPIGLEDRARAQRAEQLRLTQVGRKSESTPDSPNSLAELESATRAVSSEELRQSLELATRCQDLTKELEQLTVERFNDEERPSLRGLRTTLEEILGFLAGCLADRASSEASHAEGAAADDQHASDSRVVEPPPRTPMGQASENTIRTRTEALARLRTLAEYFLRTEPHSPISYLVQRAVRWGEMPLEQLLQEVVKDANALNQIRDTLGIPSPES